MDALLHPSPLVWPLAMLVFLLVLLSVVREELKPVIKAMVPTLAQNASKNATVYAIAFAFGLSASLSAFYDMFKDLDAERAAALSWWQFVACFCKVANPFVVAALAYVLKPAADSRPPGLSAAPFPAPPVI